MFATRWNVCRPLMALISLAVLFSLAPAARAEADDGDLRAEMRKLRQRVEDQDARIRQLTERSGSWLDERHTEVVQGIVKEMLADAETRASLLDGSLTAGHDGSFFIRSGDGSFVLRIKGMIQLRHNTNLRDNPPVITSGATVVDDGDDLRYGFELARTRFGFMGNIIDKSWSYKIWLGFNDAGNDTFLDVWFRKTLDNGLAITVGQMKTPLLKEYLVSETALQAIERSLVSGKLSGSYTQAIALSYSNDQVRATLALGDGAGTLNTEWNKPDTDIAATARGEVKLKGQWSQANDLEAWVGEEMLIVIGGAVHYQDGEYNTMNPTASLNLETQIVRWTVDGHLEYEGMSLFVAVVGDHQNINGGASADVYGLVVQGAVFVTDDLEVLARYEWGDDDNAATKDLSVVTIGMNYFFKQHRMKVSADVGYAFNPVAAFWAKDSFGWRTDTAGQDGQILVRTQFHLLF